MIGLRIMRVAFLVATPLVIVFHVATSRVENDWLRGAGLFSAFAWLLALTWLAHAPCASCGRAFFSRWLGAQLPVGLFVPNARCPGCARTLRS